MHTFQIIGSERSYGRHKSPGNAPREITMWIGVKHQEKKALELFTREIAPAGTGMGKACRDRVRIFPVDSSMWRHIASLKYEVA